MELFNSPNTCSAAEVGGLLQPGNAGSLEVELKNLVDDAAEDSRRALVAYVADYQAANKELMKALKANRFKKVGSYVGNSANRVYVYMRA